MWKTTPIPALHRESGIQPATLLLDAQRSRFAARLKSLDEAHPLARRTTTKPVIRGVKRACQSSQGAYKTRLERTAQLVPDCPRPQLLKHVHTTTRLLQTRNKEETAARFLKWLQSHQEDLLVVYSDGSQLSSGASGYGYAVHQHNATVHEGSGRLGPAEVFDAEAVGALEGLRAAVNLPEAEHHSIVVCLDNLAASSCLLGTASDSSQQAFLSFQDISATHGNVSVRWVPGHTNIPGNDQADALAKAGCELPKPADAKPTLAHIRRMAKKRSKEAFQSWWQQNAPERYKELNLGATADCPKELLMPRPILHHLLAARSHHGDFADYHERFNHDTARITCSCGRRKTPSHIFYCRKVAPRHRLRLTPSAYVAIHQAIGKDCEKFTNIAKESSFFRNICPQY
ncbi:MAG: ribonuclease H family protein [Candidatus Binatia bacterium]